MVCDHFDTLCDCTCHSRSALMQRKPHTRPMHKLAFDVKTALDMCGRWRTLVSVSTVSHACLP